MRTLTMLPLLFSALMADLPILKTGQTAVYRVGDDGTYQTGTARAYSRADSVVLDHATGLNWYDGTVGSSMNWSSALSHCDALGEGWRLPTQPELRTLVDHGRINNAIDPVFEQTADTGDYWQSLTYAPDPSFAWLLGFAEGYEGMAGKDGLHHVRCVLGENDWTRSFVRGDTNVTVRDVAAGLVWQDDAAAGTLALAWNAAIDHCEALELDGATDWRLPNINELYSLTDFNRSDPAIDPAFEHVAIGAYWSSTTYQDTHGEGELSDGARSVYFYDGVNDVTGKEAELYVRCVRGGRAAGRGMHPALIMYMTE